MSLALLCRRRRRIPRAPLGAHRWFHPSIETLESRLVLSAMPFSAMPAITTGADGATAVVAGDFDGDGDPDVLSASISDNRVAWYENDGAGGFVATHLVTGTALAATSVFAADLDRDGDLDVLTTSIGNSTVAWYENADGQGQFGPRRIISATSIGANSVVAADLDGDSDLDVIAASLLDDTVAWFENVDGQGTFGPKRQLTTSADGASAVVADDVDGDGDLDVIYAAVNHIGWHENTDARGTFGPSQSVDSAIQSAVSVATGDLDGDGDIDVAAASLADGTISWYENLDGAGTFSMPRLLLSSDVEPRSVRVVDLDSDGDLDVVAASESDGTVGWFENVDGQGNFSSRHIISNSSNGAQAVYAADLDRDGDLDVLAASSSDDTIGWFRNDTIHREAGFGSSRLVSALAPDSTAAVSDDFDGDGDPDLLIATVDDRLVLYANRDGEGDFDTAVTVAGSIGGVTRMLAADVDRDGRPDVVVASQSEGAVLWYRNEGAGAFGTRRVVAGGLEGDVLEAFDVDRDGDLDLISTFSGGGSLVWLENLGASFWPRRTLASGLSIVRAIAAADVDVDGDIDLVVASSTTVSRQVNWLENLGSSFAAPRLVSSIVADPRHLSTADLNRDGRLDLVIASTSDGRVYWQRNTGGTSPFAFPQLISAAAPGVTQTLAIDLDYDGDLDLVVTSHDDSRAPVWYANTNGQGSFAAGQVIAAEWTGVGPLLAVDLDRSGETDLVTAAAEQGTLAWIPSQAAQLVITAVGTAPASLPAGAADDVLRIDVSHLGRPGDADAQLAALGLRFETSTGMAISNFTANFLVRAVHVYRDDGNGRFDGPDPLVTTLDTLSLIDGAQQLDLPGGVANLRVSPGDIASFFVVVELSPMAAQSTAMALRVTHLPSGTISSRGEYAGTDGPLAVNVASASSGPFVATERVVWDMATTSSGRNITLRRNGGHVELVDDASGNTLYDLIVPPLAIVPWEFHASAAHSDRLTVDFSAGGFFALRGGIHLLNAQQIQDRLAVIGAATTDVRIVPSTAGGGLGQITATGGAASTAISFGGLPTIELSGMESLTYTTPGGSDLLLTMGTLVRGMVGQRITGASGGLALPAVLLTDVAEVRMDTGTNDQTGADADTIYYMASTLPAGLVDLSFALGPGSDVVDFNNSSLTLPGSLVMEGTGGLLQLDGGTVTADRFALGTNAISGYGILRGEFVSHGALLPGGGSVQRTEPLELGGDDAIILSIGLAELGPLTTFSGGHVRAPGGLYVDAGSILQGHGVVEARIAAAAGSLIRATGDLELGDAALFNGFVSSGTLDAASHAVTLHDRIVAVLGANTVLGDDHGEGTLHAPSGLAVMSGNTLSGWGTVNGAASLHGTAIGTGPSDDGPSNGGLRFVGDVNGTGAFSGRVRFAGRFDPSSEMDVANLGEEVIFEPTSRLVVQYNGSIAGFGYDLFNISGHVELGGTIEVVANSALPVGHSARIMAFGSARGQFDAFVGFDLGNGKWLQPVVDDAGLTLKVVSVPYVMGRHIFYNNSSFDGQNLAAGAADDAAVAFDKRALLPGQTATFANYTSYVRGINGVMIDIAGLAGTPTASDFLLTVGNSEDPSLWSTAPAPSQITVRAGAGTAGAHRVTLVWPDNAIEKQWLRVVVLPTTRTGLTSPDIFYFGNAIGDTGGNPYLAAVDPSDELQTRQNPTSFLDPAAVDNPYDVNRDGHVSPADQLIVRRNATSFVSALRLITAPSSATAAALGPSRTETTLPIDTSPLASASTSGDDVSDEGLAMRASGALTTIRDERLWAEISDGDSVLNLATLEEIGEAGELPAANESDWDLAWAELADD
ncbi:MAG: VCBS repeat-containing protein [Pirellulales bacterium]